MWIIDVIAGVLYVASSTIWGNEKYRHKLSLNLIAGGFAVVSTILLIIQGWTYLEGLYSYLTGHTTNSTSLDPLAPEQELAKTEDGRIIAVVADIYRPFFNPRLTISNWRDSIPWTDEAKKSIRSLTECEKRAGLIIDWDPTLAAQDSSLSDPKFLMRVPAQDGSAMVDARFLNSGRPTTVSYDMRYEHGQWRVNDVWDAQDKTSTMFLMKLVASGMKQNNCII